MPQDLPFTTHKWIYTDIPKKGRCSGIYLITCNASGKHYIGCTSNLRARFFNHRSHLRRGTHGSPHLQAAWNKYGEGVFVFRVLELTDCQFLVSREQHYMDKFHSYDPERGYNICREGSRRTGVPHTAEARAKISRALSGRKLTPTHRQSLSHAHKGQQTSLGLKHSEETKAKISNTKRGVPLSQKAHKRVTAAIRRTRCGVPRAAETKARISMAKYGKQATEDTKAKLREAWKRRKSKGQMGAQKLTGDAVREIRSKYAAGGRSYRSLALEYHVDQSMIGRIIRNQNWTHL